MRLQSITRNFLTSIFLFSLVYAAYVPPPTDHRSSTKNAAAARVAVRGGDNSAMDQTTIGNHSDPAISKRSNPKMPIKRRGATCDGTFYPKDFINKVAIEACYKLYKNKPGKIRQKLMSCAPNVPYCNYNFPHLYKGPPEFFDYTEPLYVWPIGKSLFKKFIGSKGNDRIVFDLSSRCILHGLIHKNFWGKWSLCKSHW